MGALTLCSSRRSSFLLVGAWGGWAIDKFLLIIFQSTLIDISFS